MNPAIAASDAPMKKVTLTARLTLIPTMDAASKSCDMATTCEPIFVLLMNRNMRHRHTAAIPRIRSSDVSIWKSPTLTPPDWNSEGKTCGFEPAG